MKKIIFIGAFDKTDMLIYAAKILTLMQKKVLIVDTTLLKKSRYIVPSMVQEKQYITNYEEIDFAIGFENFESIVKYQQSTIGQAINYDYVLFDIDRAIAYKKFNLTAESKHFVVTSFDVYNLKRAVQILAHIDKNATVTRVYYTKNMIQEEDAYFRHLVSKINIKWDENNLVYFPFETEDQDAIFINQRTGRIQLKGLSKTYIDSLVYLLENMTGESSGNLKKALKRIEI